MSSRARTARRGLVEIYRRFWPLVGPDRAALGIASLLLICAAGTDTITVLLFSDIVDLLTAGGGLGDFWRPAAWWLLLAVTGGICTFGGGWLTARTSERFILTLRNHVFAHLQRLGPDMLSRYRTGDLVARLSADLEAIESVLSTGLVHLLASSVAVVFFLAALVWLRWDLALMIAALSPLLVVAVRRFSRQVGALSVQERAGNAAITAELEESITTISLSQAYHTEDQHAHRLDQQGRRWLRLRLAQTGWSTLYACLSDLAETLAVLVVLGVGAWEIASGRMTIGTLVAFATYLGFLFPPTQRLGEFALNISTARASSDRITDLLHVRVAVSDPAHHDNQRDHNPRLCRIRPADCGRLRLCEVTFRYPGSSTEALRAVSFTVDPGQLVLVTGPSGAGKSTLSHLLARLYDPHAGSITLDGTNIAHYGLTALRRSVTLLPQQAPILTGTIAQNIAYGSPHASLRQVTDAAQAAGADTFIRALPEGYATQLGQHGPRLSGGQRQRLALARAFLRDSPLLVLDEPTTGLDNHTTNDILPALRTLAAHRSTLLISHDLSLAELADTVIVLRDGAVIQHGPPTQLASHPGTYRDLLHRHPPNPRDSGSTIEPLQQVGVLPHTTEVAGRP